MGGGPEALADGGAQVRPRGGVPAGERGGERGAGRADVAVEPGIRKPVTFSRLEEAPLSVSFRSFRLIFGRVIISPRVLEAWMLFLKTCDR